MTQAARSDADRDALLRLLEHDQASILQHNVDRFERLAEGHGRSIVLCGAAAVGRYALGKLRALRIEPRAFADNNRSLWGAEVDGLPVLAVDTCVARWNDDSIFVTALYNGSGVRRQLRELGCRRVIPFPHLFWRHASHMLPHFALGQPDTFFAERDDVLRAFDLYADAESRHEYVLQLERRLLLHEEEAPRPRPHSEMYFPPGVFAPRAGEVMVDCGAFDGDTLRAVIEAGLSFERLYALEPDPGNFAKLSSFAATLAPALQARLSLHRRAVGAEHGTLRFDAQGNTASGVSADGDTEVECVRLDDLLSDTRPTYIKIDIEGGETAALRGARETIARARPFVAVSVEHRLDDLWRHPTQLASLHPGYAFHLRRYSEEYLELACYAVPARF